MTSSYDEHAEFPTKREREKQLHRARDAPPRSRKAGHRKQIKPYLSGGRIVHAVKKRVDPIEGCETREDITSASILLEIASGAPQNDADSHKIRGEVDESSDGLDYSVGIDDNEDDGVEDAMELRDGRFNDTVREQRTRYNTRHSKDGRSMVAEADAVIEPSPTTAARITFHWGSVGVTI
ncbi:Kinase a-anchor protein [Globisporangium polare]